MAEDSNAMTDKDEVFLARALDCLGMKLGMSRGIYYVSNGKRPNTIYRFCFNDSQFHPHAMFICKAELLDALLAADHFKANVVDDPFVHETIANPFYGMTREQASIMVDLLSNK